MAKYLTKFYEVSFWMTDDEIIEGFTYAYEFHEDCEILKTDLMNSH